MRPIGATGERDAMGPYPIFCCADWAGLEADLAELDLVSVALVADPFGGWTRELLERCFPDVLKHFKDHFVVELGALDVHPHHRRNVAKASVEVSEGLGADEWLALYSELVRRHDIRGVAAFSPASLSAQLRVPGMVALRAEAEGSTVGATLWYVQGDVAYYHLAAYTPAGYERRASFALFARAFELFAERGLRWASLGAGAGASGDPDDGLSRFKRGWATGTRPAFFGGRVLDRAAYARLGGDPGWFPAYRGGEFA